MFFVCLEGMFEVYQKESTNREYIKNGFVQEKIDGKQVWIKKDILIKKNKNE